MVAAVRLKQRLSGHVESHDEITVPVRAGQCRAVGTARRRGRASLRVVNMPLGSSLLAVARSRMRIRPSAATQPTDDAVDPEREVPLVPATARAARNEELRAFDRHAAVRALEQIGAEA